MQAGGRMFPDEIVVCGDCALLRPYVDPGLPLARELRDRVERYIDDYGNMAEDESTCRTTVSSLWAGHQRG